MTYGSIYYAPLVLTNILLKVNMATRASMIKELEADISLKQRKLAELLNQHDIVEHGDFIILLRDYEWVASKGARMWVDEVCAGHILVRSEEPKYRHYGIYWISNNDYVKD